MTATKAQAAEWFYLNVARCLYSREHGGGVEDLPPQAKADLRPALPSERFLFKDPATKVWTTDLYGAHVLLAELGPDKCVVVADQLPVDATFRDVVARLQKADPLLRDDSVKPGGYWPIAYQLGRSVEASRFTVRLEGSEPGGLAHPLRMLKGHASRFSLLIATIERSPAVRSGTSPQSCEMNLPDTGPLMGPGTVQGVESREISASRIAAVQQRVKARIDPDYADTPRVLVHLDSGKTHAVATLASMPLHPGDRVEVLGLARNPMLPCNYLPVRVSSILSASQ